MLIEENRKRRQLEMIEKMRQEVTTPPIQQHQLTRRRSSTGSTEMTSEATPIRQRKNRSDTVSFRNSTSTSVFKTQQAGLAKTTKGAAEEMWNRFVNPPELPSEKCENKKKMKFNSQLTMFLQSRQQRLVKR